MQLSEHKFVSWDGTSLFYRAWLPPAPPTQAILLFHRGHEHSGRWESFINSFGMDDVAIFAWDQRGHGRSDGERGFAPDLAAVIRDADWFARHVQREHGISTARTAVVASSLGAVVATAWVHDFAPPVCGLVLAAAAFEVKLYVPLAIPFLRVKESVLPGGKVKSFVKSSMLSGDRAEQLAYDSDPLIFRQIAVNLLLDLHYTGRRLVDDAPAMATPTLLLVAETDWVVKLQPQLDFFRSLGSAHKRLVFVDGGRHALFNDTVTPKVAKIIEGFLKDCFARAGQGSVINTNEGQASRTEYDLLRMPSAFRWRAMRQVIRLGGVFSDGIRLGKTSGFDSGQSLDYVYANKASGLTPIGRMVDRGYLDAIGWRGIRVRRKHLEAFLREAVDRTIAEGRAVHLLDIAAGPGRYVLELMQDLRDKEISAELRDYRQANLDAAQTLARSLGVTSAAFNLADAFDRSVVASAMPRPSIAIVSGLYELFPENECVRQSLAGLGDAVVDGGYLIYTCQPWHPQVEFIARTLTNREGQPWVMRRRSQAEMDALVREAGFEKIDQATDRWGIFTVALARRVRL